MWAGRSIKDKEAKTVLWARFWRLCDVSPKAATLRPMPDKNWLPAGYDDLDRVLYSRCDIQRRVAEIAADIAKTPEPRLVVGVLTGAAIFAADLVRELGGATQLDFIAVSSYGDATQSSGHVRLIKDLSRSIEGYHVILAEDIVDTGLTMAYLRDSLGARSPASLQLCTLLDKREARKVEIQVDHTGFACPDEFVVGYGMDYAGWYRNLPEIGVLKASIYSE